MRDKVSHDYFGVNCRIVWGVVQKELPKLRVAIAALLEQLMSSIVTAKLGPRSHQ